MIGRILISKVNEGVQEVHSMRRKEQDKGTESPLSFSEEKANVPG